MRCVVLCFAVLIPILMVGAEAPYLDPDKPVEIRVRDLISRLALEEKSTLLNHNGPVVERFQIRSDKWNQCLHGVWWDQPTTMFPVSIGMAATWDTKLIQDVAAAISDEARAIYNGWHQNPNFKGEKKGLIYRAPVINISRNPYWGRINECYGEDPFLTGRIGVAFVKGLQGDDTKYLKLVSTLSTTPSITSKKIASDFRRPFRNVCYTSIGCRIFAIALWKARPSPSWPPTMLSTACRATSIPFC